MAAAQKRVFVAICLFAGAVALASGQRWNPNSCSSGAQRAASTLQQTIARAVSRYTSAVQETGSQAVDTSRFQGDLEKLTNSVTTLTNMEGGVDAQRFVGVYMDNMRTIASLASKAINPSLFSGAMGDYLTLVNTISTANTQFLSDVTSACMPTSRQLKQQSS